jgi:hypothetical protein
MFFLNYRFDMSTETELLEKYYSYEFKPYDEYGPFDKLYIKEYRVVKKTKKGVWIKSINPWGLGYEQHFVLNDSRKKYAYQTKEQALFNFIKRKEIQIRYTERNLRNEKKH